ncbi:MAG: hypothetical protein KF763_11550 [Cyclobacteriaceae bacterium]|nr:hypothetical protein [Cyclobacteriaceae bacterium]
MLLLVGWQHTSGQIYSSINYGMEHGLPQSQVLAITQDDYGYLWVGTSAGGLSRFDGKEFVNFTTGHGLVSPSVLSLAWTPETLWIGTAQGLNIMSKGKIVHHAMLQHLEVTKLLPFDTAIWATTSKGGIHLINRDSVKFYSSNNGFTNKRVLDIEYDSVGTLWALGAGGHIYIFENDNFRLYHTVEDSTAKSLLPVGKQLLVGAEKGLITYQIVDGTLLRVKEELPDATVNDIQIIDNEIWLVIQNGLLWKDQDKFKWMSSRNGLTNVPIFAIFRDKEGIVWAGANIYGLYKFLRGPFQRLAFPPQTFVDVITDIKQFKSDTTLITTLGKGVFEVYPDFSIHKVNLPEGANNISNAMAWNEKIVLASFEKGILISSGDKFVPLPNQPTYATPPFFAANINHQVFVSDRKSLFVIGNNGLEKVLDGINVFTVYKTDSAYILGTDEGLYEWRHNETKKIDTMLPLDRHLITSLMHDQSDNLLIGTLGQGLWIFPGGNIKATNPIHLLPFDHITFLIFDSSKLYCGTQRGICVYEFHDNLTIKSQKWLNRNNGLLGIETINETVLKHSDGHLWFGTVDGLYLFDTKQHYPILPKPILSITNIEVSGLPDSLLIQGWFTKIPAVLPTKSSTINFDFKAVSLLMPEMVQYQYRLIGLSERWSAPSVRSSIRFTNLTPGDYTFEVRAVNELGAELDKKTIMFHIVIPFWQMWWFRILLVILLIIAAWSIIRLRISQAMKLQLQIEKHDRQMRRELAKDFHDELGNHLASIISLLQVLKVQAVTMPENLRKQFSRLDRHAQELFFGTKDFIASIDPQHESLEWTLLYLRDFGEQLFSDTSISFGFASTEPWQQQLRVRAYFSRHIILIVKEAMTNALKHSEATEVTLHVSKTGSDLIISISDNGMGISDASFEASSAIGFESMRDRAKKLDATLIIQSSKAGTIITIKKENYAHWAG